mmetsp:Transcript_72594/g.183552  ORF Transcript_72594/g.183552 Transcript_72594/m.183552 type:complete len:250 (+) Transcript_72594:2-751(+)
MRHEAGPDLAYERLREPRDAVHAAHWEDVLPVDDTWRRVRRDLYPSALSWLDVISVEEDVHHYAVGAQMPHIHTMSKFREVVGHNLRQAPRCHGMDEKTLQRVLLAVVLEVHTEPQELSFHGQRHHNVDGVILRRENQKSIPMLWSRLLPIGEQIAVFPPCMLQGTYQLRPEAHATEPRKVGDAKTREDLGRTTVQLRQCVPSPHTERDQSACIIREGREAEVQREPFLLHRIPDRERKLNGDLAIGVQ